MHCNKLLEYVGPLYRDFIFCFDKRSKKSVPSQNLQKNVAPNLFISITFKVDWKKLSILTYLYK